MKGKKMKKYNSQERYFIFVMVFSLYLTENKLFYKLIIFAKLLCNFCESLCNFLGKL